MKRVEIIFSGGYFYVISDEEVEKFQYDYFDSMPLNLENYLEKIFFNSGEKNHE